jgi:hypothetical protein
MSANQGTYLLKDLREGVVYRDVLSGYLVLVLGRAPFPKEGLLWNPVKGEHQRVSLHDHQLVDASAPTALKADTRRDKGYHG